jgi:hypothetical protein
MPPTNHQFNITHKTDTSGDIDVGLDCSTRPDTFSLGPARLAIHAWRTGDGTPTCCVCVELTGQCPLPLHKKLALQPGASGKYKIATVRPTAVIAGTAGTLDVGSNPALDDRDPHRPR